MGDKSAAVERVKGVATLMGVRVEGGKKYLVPLEFLNNDLAITRIGREITAQNARDITLASLNVKDLRRGGADFIEMAGNFVTTAIEKAVIKTLEMGGEYDASAEMYLEQLLRKMQTEKYGSKT